MIENYMQINDESTATRLVKVVNAAGYKLSKSMIILTLMILGWIFCGNRFCQMIQTQKGGRRMQWTHENLHNRF